MHITGGEAIALMLRNEGVEVVFGIVDGTYVSLIANLKKHGIRLVSPRHETSAAHMAGAYARLTGKLGVCIASNGPGVANILPGVAVENAEGNRVLLISSSRRNPITYPERGGTYQYFDQVGVIGAMSKYSASASTPERIPEIMRQAFRSSYTGRPGVVFVDVPENYINGKHKFSDTDFRGPSSYRRTLPVHPSAVQIEKAALLLSQANFPVIHAGSGIIHAQAFQELEKVANLLGAPVTTSWGARGALCEDDELSIPMIYIETNNRIRRESDLILTLGSRMGETDWWGKPPYWGDPSRQKMIQVDIDEEFLGRHKPVDLAIQADVKEFLSELAAILVEMKDEKKLQDRRSKLQEYRKRIEKEREKLDRHLEDRGTPLNSSHLANLCKEVFPKRSIAVFDGGNTAVWGQMFYRCTEPGTGLGTAKMGMLGAGIGQALGACVAEPEKQVYCIIGDGAMGFHAQEVETAVRNNLKPIFIVACDKQWGMVKMSQQIAFKPIKTMIRKSLEEGETINADLNEIAFDKMAESMGAYGERVDNPDALEKALNNARASGKCAVIHVDVDPVKHMWAPGLLHFKKMHEEPAG